MAIAKAPVWSEPYPGIVMRACGDATDAFEVHHETGRQLRFMSEARLCFECGPDGGVYHPDVAGIAFLVRKAATVARERRLVTQKRLAPLAFEYVRDMARIYDKDHNRFRGHEHHTFLPPQRPDGPRRDGPNIEHAHTDGQRAHGHPETGPAAFRSGKERAKPFGPEFDFAELTEAERTFRVVIPYRYIEAGGGWDGKANRHMTRADFRRSMELYVYAIRMQALGMPVHPSGPGAIPMTTHRLMGNFGLEPRYEIPGWQPTPWLGLP